MKKPYPTDLSDAEWFCIEPYLPAPRDPRRPWVHSLSEILDAIYYIVRSGCAWRLLPHEFPPWKKIHHYFRIWHSVGRHLGAAAHCPGLAFASTSQEILNLAQVLWIPSR